MTNALISGPASGLVETRLTNLLRELSTLMKSEDIDAIHIYTYSVGPASFYVETSNRGCFGGYHCGPQGALFSDNGPILSQGDLT